MRGTSRVSSALASHEGPQLSPSWFGLASEDSPPARRRAVVLVVGGTEAERGELRAPLDGLDGVRVIEASTVDQSLSISQEVVVHLLVVDSAYADVSRTLPWLPAVVVTNDVDATLASSYRTRVVARPVGGEVMRQIIDTILRT